MKTVRVSTSRPYDIIIDKGALSDVANYIPENFAPPRKICLISDSTVNTSYSAPIKKSLTEAGYEVFKILFPSGEHSKNLTIYSNMLESLADEGFNKSDLILVLGGGTVGDIAGFVAGTYMRGVNYIYVPTTLLSIIDSAIGGKTGINLLGGKDLAGVFWNPSLVVVDPLVLDTLPEETLKDGMAEALKCAVVSDASLVSHIQDRRYDYIIDRCLSIKRPLVEVDEFDTGLRQLLSFGHTFGNVIEKVSSYNVSHGQAVALGMIAEAKAAFKAGYTNADISEELYKILEDLGFETEFRYRYNDVYSQAMKDKKIRDGFMNIVVPDVIGKCSIRKITVAELQEYIKAAFA